jgi:hypothetical protein
MSEFAFLFYVNDWAGGTQWLTRLQRGGYLDLLLYQVNNTCFSLEEIKKILGNDFDNIWTSISCKFIEENGKFYNKKMREVLEARFKFTDSRRNNRLNKTKKHKNNIRKTSVKLMEKEKEKEIEEVKDNIIVEKIKFLDTVFLTEKQYESLVEEFGEQDTKKLIEILDNYKDSKGKKYKNDYKAIKSWCVERLSEIKIKQKNNNGKTFTDYAREYIKGS